MTKILNPLEVVAGRKPPGPPGVGRVSPLTRKLLAPRGASDKPWKNSPPPPPAKSSAKTKAAKAVTYESAALTPLLKEFIELYREYHPARGIAGDVETGLKYRLVDLRRDIDRQPPHHREKFLRDEIDDMRRALHQAKPAKSNMLYPDMVPVPEGKIRIDDTGLWRKYPSNRETIKEQRVDGPQIRGTVKLQYFTRGFEPAGSVSRWTESGWSVRWMDERMNSYQGRIFKDDDQGEAKARAYFDVVTNNGKPGEAAAKEKFKKLGGYEYGKR